MKSKGMRKVLSYLLVLCLVITLMPCASFADEQAAQDIDVTAVSDIDEETAISDIAGEELSELPEGAQVIEEESSETMTTFALENGDKAKVFYSYPVRYKDDDGKLQEIKPELVTVDKAASTSQGITLREYGYENKSGKYKQYLPNSLTESTPVLMEYDRYGISMAPTGYMSSLITSTVADVKSERVETVAGTIQAKDVKAVYGSKRGAAYIEYTSQNDGIKEEIILNKKPENNMFRFKLTLKGLTYRMNSTDNGISLYDDESGELAAYIGAPNMNDATGNAYSEDLTYTMAREGASDTYILTLNVSEDYLDDSSREYPVTIDPSATWLGSSEVKDAYIIDQYPTTNFYDSSTKVMPGGKGSTGKHRTLIHLANLKATLLGYTIKSANFTAYETGNGSSSKVVRLYPVTSSWAVSTVTWNKCPSFGSYLDGITTNGNANHKCTWDISSWVSDVAGGDSNHGILLKNQVESTSGYTEFYGSRTSATSYRPKLVVTYSDVVSTPTTVSTDKSKYEQGESVSISWSGISCNSLKQVEYRIGTADEDWNDINTQYVAYTKLAGSKSSGTATVPGTGSFSPGRYKIFVRGVSTTGENGTGRGVRFMITPTAPSSVSVNKDFYSPGENITVTWSGIASSNGFSRIEYAFSNMEDEDEDLLDFNTLTSSGASSGTASLQVPSDLEGGEYFLYVRGVSSNNVEGTALSCPVEIGEDEAPVVGSLSLTNISSGYNKPKAISVLADYISDEAPVKASNLMYSLYGPAGDRVGESLSSCTMRTNSDGTYWTTFTIPESYVNKSGTYTLYFWVFDDAINLGWQSKTFRIDADAPTGSISLNDMTTGADTDTAKNSNTLITAAPTDAYSGIQSACLYLYKGTQNNIGELVKTFNVSSSQNTFTEPVIFNFDASEYDDGEYVLKLDMTDKVGYTATVYKDITIQNPIIRPVLGVDVSTGNSAVVSWSFREGSSELKPLIEIDKLHHIEYKIDGSSVWNTVNITDKRSGQFNISIPAGMTGTHAVYVRGVESTGTAGDAARLDFNTDSSAPTVAISSITRGVVYGSVYDDNLSEWSIYIKLKDAEDTSYVQLKTGGNSVTGGRIASIDLDGYTSGTYTVKLEAVDDAGNKTSDTEDINITGEYDNAQSYEHISRIVRSLGQDNRLPDFRVSSTAESIKLKAELTNVAWFVNDQYVAGTDSYSTDFAALADGTARKIAAVGRDASGNVVYSNNVYLNALKDSFTLEAAAEGQTEKTVALSEDAVCFKLNAPQQVTLEAVSEIQPAEPEISEMSLEEEMQTEQELQNDEPAAAAEDVAITYYAKVGNGSYVQIIPGQTVHINQLNSQMISADSVTIKAVASDDALNSLDTLSLGLGVMDSERFTVVTGEEYWAADTSAQDKINYKTYVKWNTPEVLPENLSYEVYRSTLPNFVPGENNLVADNIRAGYWCDINAYYGKTFYYKVRAVIKDESGNIISASSYSSLAESTAIDENEYSKLMGSRQYFAYADVATPSGNGHIEKSEGNFLYEQTDAELANEQLAVIIGRAYNSLASSFSGFGYGWTHSYDIELLKLGADENLDDGMLVLRDGSGTIYKFKADGETYISGMGKYVTLKKASADEKHKVITLPDAAGGSNTVTADINNVEYIMSSRDGITYYFDGSGRLVVMEESNGNVLLFDYDSKKGLLSKITTGNNISVDITYNDGTDETNVLTIKEILLPDGQKLKYEYEKKSSSDKLKNFLKYVKKIAPDNSQITYTYTYTGGKLTGLTDGMSNTYNVVYDTSASGRAVEFRYPAAGGISEKIKVSKSGNCTTTEKLFGSQTVKKEKDYFNGKGFCVLHEDVDLNDNVKQSVEYTYLDYLLQKETVHTKYNRVVVTEQGQKIITEEDTVKEKTYQYNEDTEVIEQETDEDKAVTDFEYALSALYPEYLPSGCTETIDGIVTSSEIYTYDIYGNVTSVKDLVAGTLTQYEYYTKGTGNFTYAIGEVKSEKVYLTDENGNLVNNTPISSSDTSFTYNPASDNAYKTVTVTETAAETVTATVTVYDVAGRIMSEEITSSKTGQEGSRESHTYIYDGFGRVISSVTETAKLDSLGNEIEGTLLTTSETKTYNGNGSVVSETGTDGITKSYVYDALNRVVSTTTSKGNLSQTETVTYSYGNVSTASGETQNGNLKKTDTYAFITEKKTGSLSEETSWVNGYGQTVRVKSGNTVKEYAYDAAGNRFAELVYTDSENTSYILNVHVYDADGRETAAAVNPVWDETQGCFTIGELSICTEAEYDNRGNLLKSTDAEGNETGYEYDNQSRLVKVILVKKTEASDGTITVSTDNSMNYTYSEGYDSNDRYYSKVTATNAKGAVSEEISDANGNVIKTTDKGTSGDTAIESAYEYDARGNLVKEIHSAGDYITYSYDSFGRVTEKQQYSSAGVQLYRTVYTYYSGLNLVKDMKDYEAGTLYRHTYYEYDSLGRISAKAESNSEMTDAEKSAKAVSYTYNLRGEVTGTGYGSSLTNIAAGEISGTRYEYNSYGQLTGVYVKKGTSEYKVKEYSYNPDGNVMQVKDFYNYTSGTGQYIALSYSYDAYGRVTAMVYTDSNGAVIEKHEYAYNRNGQVVKETNLNNVSVNPVNETRSYTYDYMGNLLKSEITGSTNVTTLYTYDKVGNRLTKKQNNVTTTYTYNGLNQLTGENGGGNSLSYVYDANGNQIRITGTADGTSVNKVFAYTPSGLMSSYTSGTDTQVNRYNGDGQRVSKTEGSDVTNYFYQNGSVLYTTDSLGNVKVFNLLNGSDILGTLRINGNNVSSYFYTEDMRGSTVNVIDNSGNTVLSYWYDDFGQVNEYRESGNSLINEVQYTGAIYDELTGLLYLNARFYDPATGRFISQDTYRGERDDAGTWHLYAYCANDPVNYVDPSGHKKTAVGFGLEFALTKGVLNSVGALLDLVWLNDNVKTRKDGKSLHAYGAFVGAAAKNKQTGIVQTIMKNPKNLLSKKGLKRLVKSISKTSPKKGIGKLANKFTSNWVGTVGFFVVMADTRKFTSYKDYEGEFGSASISYNHGCLSVSKGAKNLNLGAAITTAGGISFSITAGFGFYWPWATAKFRQVGSSISSAVKRMAK